MDTKFSVALHILIFISETNKIATSDVLAKSVNTNSSHIRKITALLKSAHLITSNQGKSGFTLAKDKKDISLADIYRAIYSDRPILHTHDEPNSDCPVGKHIQQLVEPTFYQAQQAFLKELANKSLDDMIRELYIIGEKHESRSTYSL